MSKKIENNVIVYLRNVRQRCPDKVALIEDQGKTCVALSFQQLWEKVRDVSAGLSSAGLCPHGNAIIMIPMSIDLYVVLLAILKIGARAIFFDPWMKLRQIADFCSFVSPSAFIGSNKSHLLRIMNTDLQKVPVSVTTNHKYGGLLAKYTLNEISAFKGNDDIAPVEESETALVTFTSGSSGRPKGANRTHEFLSAQHLALKTEFDSNENDIVLAMFPVFTLHNLASGITTVIPDMNFSRVSEIKAGPILGQIKRHNVSTCIASPPFFNQLAEYLADGTVKMQRIITGGAPVADKELVSWQKTFLGTEIIIAYGSTEAEPVAHITSNRRLELGKKQSSCEICAGRLIDSIEGKIIRIHKGPIKLGEKGWAEWELSNGEIGELIVSGNHVCREYYQNKQAAEENKIIEQSGKVWHRLGDTGYLDEQRQFWLAGRVHSTIVRNGENFHSLRIEKAIEISCPTLGRVAVIGVPDDRMGEKVVLVLSADSVEDNVKERLIKNNIVVDEIIPLGNPLPVDPRHNAKIDYIKLRKRINNA